MNIVDFSSKQIITEKLQEKDEFFRDFLIEYGNLCEIPYEVIEHKTELQAKKTDKKVLQSELLKIKEILKSSEEKILNFFGEIKIPPVILFTGPFAWDGHGIIVNGKSYIFLNMNMMNHHFNLPGFTTDVHAIHEMLHGIHYNIFPGYYPVNSKHIKELYYNKLLAEGIATYLSCKISKSDQEESLSFGFMSGDEVNMWMEKCNTLKKETSLSLQKSIAENIHNKELWGSLFFVPDLEPDCLTRGRFGYYYGMMIAAMAAEKIEDTSLINSSPEVLYPFVDDYFNFISSV